MLTAKTWQQPVPFSCQTLFGMLDIPGQLHLIHVCVLIAASLQMLDTLHRDYTVEWFTEHSTTPEGREDMARVRREVPNLSVHLDTDLLWNWHQMASADVFIMSLSAYSYVPAVVNAKGLIIQPKALQRCRQGPGGCHPRNWLEPADEKGALGKKIAAEVHRRWSDRISASSTTAAAMTAEVAAHSEQHSQQV